MSELELNLLFEKIDREYKKEDIEHVEYNYLKCPFCKKWRGVLKVTFKDGVELTFCLGCESVHKTLRFNRTHRVKTYVKGRNFEYQVKRLLENQGYIVFRFAGSKPLDLLAVKFGKVLFCECKTKYNVGFKEREKLGEWSAKLGFPVALFLKAKGSVEIEVFEVQPRKHWRTTYELLNDFIQFLLDNYAQTFLNDDSWVNLSQLDTNKTIWKFLFGKKEV